MKKQSLRLGNVPPSSQQQAPSIDLGTLFSSLRISKDPGTQTKIEINGHNDYFLNQGKTAMLHGESKAMIVLGIGITGAVSIFKCESLTAQETIALLRHMAASLEKQEQQREQNMKKP